jgi:hypothetical protein
MVRRISLSRLAFMIGAVILTVCAAGFVTALSSRSVANATGGFEDFNPVVGVWEVNVGGAPFGPHLFTFHSDHTFLSANPDAGDPNTSDSDGEGVWKSVGRNKVKGIFKEYNADRATHQFVSILIVTYTIKVTGDTFTGNALATETDPNGKVLGSGPATFTATRMELE